MARWMMALIAGIAVIYTATVIIAGEPTFLIPGAILLAIIVFYAVGERALTRAHMRRHGEDVGATMADDEDWAVPSAHITPDDVRPAGDSPEEHDEINPHDLPPDHPGRHASEVQAGAPGGATTGNERGAAGGRFSRTKDRTEERTGEPQRSADHAKSSGGSGAPGESEREPGQRFPL